MRGATDEQNDVLSRIGAELSEKFRPFQAGAIPDESWTLHKAVRQVFQTNSSWGLVAYENHEDLRSQIEATYAALDQALGEMGGSGRAEPWGLDKERRTVEMVELCERASILASPESPRPTVGLQRAAISGLRGIGKYRGAICAVIAEVAEARDASFGEIVDEVTELGSITDTAMLDHLERLPRTTPDMDRASDAAATSIWSGKWLGSRGNLMSDYFRKVQTLSGAWRGLEALDATLQENDVKLKV
jgi:hypothetical protein